MNLRKKMSTWFIIIIINTLIVNGVNYYLGFRKSLVEGKETGKQIVLNSKKQVELEFSTALKDLNAIESLISLTSNPNLAFQRAAKLVDENKSYRNFFYADNYQYYSQPSDGKKSQGNYTEQEWYKSALGKKYNLNYITINNHEYLEITKEVKVYGISYGVVGVNIDIQKLFAKGKGTKVGEKGFLFLSNASDGKILIHNDTEYIDKNVADLQPEFGMFKGEIKEDDLFEFDMEGKKAFLYHSYIEDLGLYLIGGTVYKEYTDAYIANMYSSGLGLLVNLLIVIVALYSLDRRIVKPIKKLNLLIKEMTKGDLTVSSDFKSKDEIGELSDSFNEFSSNMRVVIKHMTNGALEVAERNEEMMADFLNMVENRDASSIAKLKEAISNTMDNIRNQTASTEETLAGIEEVAATADSIKINVDSNIEVSNESMTLAEEGVMDMGALTQKINDISFKVVETNDRVNTLVGLSENIGNITVAITMLAEQTNLLALNAAIESARAGEAGRGFAVVAQEIKKLAEKTNEETVKIDEIVTKINNEIDTVKSLTDAVQENVNTGLELNEKVSEKIMNIKGSIDNSSEKIKEVAIGVEEQKIATDEISRAINAISDNATEIEVKETSNLDVAEDISGNLGEKLELLGSLSAKMEELIEDLNKFKI